MGVISPSIAVNVLANFLVGLGVAFPLLDSNSQRDEVLLTDGFSASSTLLLYLGLIISLVQMPVYTA